MSFYRFVAAGAVCVAVSMASSAQAALHFSQADLLSMTIDNDFSFGFQAATTGNGLTSDAHYNYPGPPHARDMTGLAGASGNLNPLRAANEAGASYQDLLDLGFGATAFYNLDATQLAALNAAIAGGETELSVMGWNDNDDEWIVGIWAIDTTWPFLPDSGIYDGLLLEAGKGGALSLDLTSIGAPLARAGVFVALVAGSADDTFHASFGVPEPTTVIVWSALGTIGFLAYRRRQLA